MEDTQRYLITGEVGRGASGVVYRARDLLAGREVALKVPAAGAGATEPARERLRREARLLSRLNHPGFVRVLDFVECRFGPALVTELVAGETLQQRLDRRSAIPLEEAIALVVQAARALAAAHRLGIVHGDVKPSNLLVTPEGDLRIADLGLSHALSAEPRSAGVAPLRGTPSYVAPEQWRGEEVDGRADLFALGVVLYRLVTGRRPFDGADLKQLVAATLRGEPAAPSSLRADLPAALDPICLDLLRSRPGERPANGEVVADRLESLVLGRVSGAAPATGPESAPREACSFDSTWPRLPLPSSRRRNRLPLLAAALLLVVTAAGLTLVRGRSDPPRSQSLAAPAASSGQIPASPRLPAGTEPAWSAARRPRSDLIRALGQRPPEQRRRPSPTAAQSSAGETASAPPAPAGAAVGQAAVSELPPRPGIGTGRATRGVGPRAALRPEPRSPGAHPEPGPESGVQADEVRSAPAPEERSAPGLPQGAQAAASARGIVEIVHDLQEGLVELRVDSRRAGLARIGPGGEFAAEESVVVSFRVPPGHHDCEVRVLSASSGGEATARWTAGWRAGEFQPRRLRLLRGPDGWRLESSAPSRMGGGG